MKELKFKAWDTKEKFFHHPLTLSEMLDVCSKPEDQMPRMGIKFKITRADLIFVQCTGLKDKHGIDIYEGDVLKYEAMPDGYPNSQKRSFKEIVRWDDMNRHTTLWSHFKDEYEVIGNIYENPDLLK